MAEFEVTANVVPEIDNRQKRKVQEELDSSFGATGGGSSSSGGGIGGLSRTNDILSDISSTLEQVRNAIVGGGGVGAVGGAISEFQTGMSRTRGRFTFSAEDLGISGQIGAVIGKGVSVLSKQLVSGFKTLKKWTRLTAINTADMSASIVTSLISIGTTIVGAVGGIGALIKGGAISLGAGALAGIGQFVGAVDILKGRINAFRNAVKTFVETPFESLGKITANSIKTFIDPTGLFEGTGRLLAEEFEKNFPDVSDKISVTTGKLKKDVKAGINKLSSGVTKLSTLSLPDDFDAIETGVSTLQNVALPAGFANFSSTVDSLVDLSLPSISFDIPSQLSGLLSLFGLGGGTAGSKGQTRKINNQIAQAPGDLGQASQAGSNALDLNFDFDVIPELDIDAKEITDNLEDEIEDQIDELIKDIEKEFQVDLP